MTEPRAADKPRAGDVGSGPAAAGPGPGQVSTPDAGGEPVGTEPTADAGAVETVEGEVVAPEPDQPDEAPSAEPEQSAAAPVAEPPTEEPEAPETSAAQAPTEAPETPEAPEAPPAGGLGAELEALRAELEERTRDLQRVTAEYANYRKRVERDRARVGEQATANVLSALLPVLDDLDRAREHGELVDGFAAVAEQLISALTKFGLTAFGEKGDPFDPNRHEAVAHLTSDEVNGPTCIDILRRGYLLGDRLLRPAMVAVADPPSDES